MLCNLCVLSRIIFSHRSRLRHCSVGSWNFLRLCWYEFPGGCSIYCSKIFRTLFQNCVLWSVYTVLEKCLACYTGCLKKMVIELWSALARWSYNLQKSFFHSRKDKAFSFRMSPFLWNLKKDWANTSQMKIARQNHIFPPLSIIMASNKKRKFHWSFICHEKQLTSLIRCINFTT